MQTEVEYKGLLYDKLFKYIFSKEHIFKDLINSYFEIKGWDKHISNFEVTAQKIMMPDKEKNMTFYGDLIGTINTGEIISIEAYTDFQEREYNKSFSYISKLYVDQMKVNGDYKKAKKVIGITFMTGNYHRNNEEIINEYGFLKRNVIQTIYKDENIMLDLIRIDLIDKWPYNYSNKRFFKWIKLINAKSIKELIEIAKGDEIMEETVEYIRKFVNDPEVLEIYSNDNLIRLNAYDDGVEQGRTEGIEQGLISTAKNMINIGLNTNIISQATGLTREQIEDLR